MLTVPEAARRVNRDPETVRRWIRAGKLRSEKIGTQHLIDERDLDAYVEEDYEMLPLPKAWRVEPHVNWVKIIRESRESR